VGCPATRRMVVQQLVDPYYVQALQPWFSEDNGFKMNVALKKALNKLEVREPADLARAGGWLFFKGGTPETGARRRVEKRQRRDDEGTRYSCRTL
jgi:hypothetical protein